MTVINEAASTDWWVPWLPLAAALLAILASMVLQHLEFRHQRNQWADNRDLEREKQLLPERVRAYATLTRSLRECVVIGIQLAWSIKNPLEHQPSGEHLERLLSSLAGEGVAGSGLNAEISASSPGRLSASDWDAARDAAFRAGSEAALLTADPDRRAAIRHAAAVVWDADPADEPDAFLSAGPDAPSGPAAVKLVEAERTVEQAALAELGLALGDIT